MTQPRRPNALHHLERLLTVHHAAAFADRALLERFVAGREETAFAALVERHGAMVLNVCRRVLHHRQDAEDACQATFLVLARKASSIRKFTSVASWLHGVAYRVALNLKRHRDRRAAQPVVDVPARDVADDATWREVQGVLDEELARLPPRLRTPLVLCYLEGKTRDEAAQQLGWSVSTLRGRLERGRKLLRSRLTRRGLALPAVLSAAVLTPSVTLAALPASLAALIVEAGVLTACGQTVAPGLAAPHVLALTERMVRIMFLAKLKIALILLLATGLFGTGAFFVRQPAVEATEPPVTEVVQAEKPKPAPAVESEPGTVVLFELLRNKPYPLNNNAYAKFKEQQARLIRGPNTLIEVVHHPKIRDLAIIKQQIDPVKWLTDQLKVDFPENGDIMRLSLRGLAVKDSTAIMDVLTDEYLASIGSAKYDQFLHQLQENERRHQINLATIQDKQRTLSDLVSRRGIKGNPGSQVQQQYLLGQLSDVARELRRVKLSRAAVEVRLGRLKDEKGERPKLAEERKQLEEEVIISTAQEKLLKQEQEELLKQEAEQAQIVGELDLLREEIKRRQAEAVKSEQEMEATAMRVEQGQPRIRLLPKQVPGKKKN